MSRIDFDGDWHGWRLSGRVWSPRNGQRITRERLAGLLFRGELELRRAGFASRRAAEANRRGRQYQSRVKVIVVDPADLRVHGGLKADALVAPCAGTTRT